MAKPLSPLGALGMGTKLGTSAVNPFGSAVESYIKGRAAKSPLASLVLGQGTPDGDQTPGVVRPDLGALEQFAGGVTGGTSGDLSAPSTVGTRTPGNPAYRAAIASIESAGQKDPYRALGPMTRGDRAYGKYQVMGNNIPSWTQEVLGRRMTPQEFLADDAAQDAVFDAKFAQSIAKYGSPEQAASVWFTGRPISPGSQKAQDVTGTSGSKYVQRFSQALQRGPSGTTGNETLTTVANPTGDPSTAEAPERLSPMERLQKFSGASASAGTRSAPEAPLSPDSGPITENRDILLRDAIAAIQNGNTRALRGLGSSDRLAALRKLAGGFNA